MKRRSFIAAAIAAVVAPLPMAAPTGAVSMASRTGRGMTTSIIILDESPFVYESYVAWGSRIQAPMSLANYQQPYGIPMKIGGTNA